MFNNIFNFFNFENFTNKFLKPKKLYEKTSPIKGSKYEKVIENGESKISLNKLVYKTENLKKNINLLENTINDTNKINNIDNKELKNERIKNVLNVQQEVEEAHLKIAFNNEETYIVCNKTSSKEVNFFQKEENDLVLKNIKIKDGFTPFQEITKKEWDNFDNKKEYTKLSIESKKSKLFNQVKKDYNWETEKDMKDYFIEKGDKFDN